MVLIVPPPLPLSPHRRATPAPRRRPPPRCTIACGVSRGDGSCDGAGGAMQLIRAEAVAAIGIRLPAPPDAAAEGAPGLAVDDVCWSVARCLAAAWAGRPRPITVSPGRVGKLEGTLGRQVGSTTLQGRCYRPRRRLGRSTGLPHIVLQAHAISFGTLEIEPSAVRSSWAASTRLAWTSWYGAFPFVGPDALSPSTGWPRSSVTWCTCCGPLAARVPPPFSFIPYTRPCAAGFPMHTLAAFA